MKRALLALALTLATPQVFAGLSAGQVLPACKKLMDENAPADYLQGYCHGWAVGVLTTTWIHSVSLGDDDGMAWCPPDEMSINQIVLIVIKGMDDRPEALHIDFDILGSAILKNVYPCKGKAKGMQS